MGRRRGLADSDPANTGELASSSRTGPHAPEHPPDLRLPSPPGNHSLSGDTVPHLVTLLGRLLRSEMSLLAARSINEPTSSA
jgi:hypothetical protein